MPFDDGNNRRRGGGGGGGPWYSTDDATSLLFFLRQAEIEGDFYQLIPATEAFEAACRIMHLEPTRVRAQLNLE